MSNNEKEKDNKRRRVYQAFRAAFAHSHLPPAMTKKKQGWLSLPTVLVSSIFSFCDLVTFFRLAECSQALSTVSQLPLSAPASMVYRFRHIRAVPLSLARLPVKHVELRGAIPGP